LSGNHVDDIEQVVEPVVDQEEIKEVVVETS